MKALKIKQIALMLITAALLVSCGEKETTKANEIIRVVKYEESTLNKDRQKLNFSGAIKPAIESNLSFKIPGTLEKINATIGDNVKQGDILAVLDKSSYNLQYQQAQAALEQVKASVLGVDAQIAEAKTGVAQAKTGIIQAESGVQQAQAAYARASSVQQNTEKEFKRFKELYLNDNIAQSDFEKIKSGLEQANAAVDQAKGAVNQAKAAYQQTLAQKEQTELLLEQAKVGKKAMEAQLSSVEKQLELAELQLSYTNLIAPVDGTISLKMSEVNENVGAGVPIFRIESGDQLEAEIFVSESAITNIHLGDKAELFISSINKEMTGFVTEVGSTTTGFGGTYAVKLSIQNEENQNLKSGMVVDVRLKTEKKESHISLPLSAVDSTSTGEKYVYVLEDIQNDLGVVAKKTVQVGDLINNRLQIISGLEEDEKVITAGISRVVPGQKVKLYREGK